MMPYTADTPERPRKDQIEFPRQPGELTLALTDRCLKYFWDETERKSYAKMARCMAALSESSKAVPCNKKVITSCYHLKQEIAFVIDVYKAKNRNTEFEDDVRGSRICAQHEWYTRMMGPYERNACAKNGEVYPTLDTIVVLTSRIKKLEEGLRNATSKVRGKVKRSRKTSSITDSDTQSA